MTERQQEIIDKSIEIIAEKGIQGLTIKNLAKAIKVTEPAIYRHFDSKTDILMAMLNNLDVITTEFTNAILAKKYTSLKKMEKILNLYFETFAKHPFWVSVIFADEIFKNEKVLAKKIHQMITSKEEIYLQLIQQAQKEGSLRNDINKQYLVLMIMGSLRLLFKRWEFSGFSFDLTKEGKKLVRSILKIIAKEK